MQTSLSQHQQIGRGIANGLVISIVSLATSLSYAALVFSGLLAPGLTEGVTAALVGSAAVGLVVTWRSSFPFAIAGVDGYHCAVLGGIAATLASTLQGSGRLAMANALYLVVLSALISGVVLYALGAARMGRWMRFVPYPVTGGFMAGVGWLMVSGGTQVVANHPLALTYLVDLLSPPMGYKVGAALAWAGVLFVVLGRSTHYLTLPVLLVGGTLGGLAALELCGLSLAQAREAGWLFGAPASGNWWTPWSAADFQLLSFADLGSHFKDLVVLALVNALTILMGATGIELETRSDIDLDGELRGHGLGQLLSAVVGGFPGLTSAGRSLLNFKLGSTSSRLAGYVAAGATLAYALIGPLLVSFIPKAILSGLIIYLGVVLIRAWVWNSRKTCSWTEYLTILLIAGVVIIWGFVTGVVVGVAAACLMFVFSYSRVSAVKHMLDGKVYSSSMVRSNAQTALLKKHGDETRIFVLQGFIFFGTADRLYRIFRRQMEEAGRPMRFVILDFRFVSGIDSSALSSFRKIVAAAQKHGATLLVSGVGPAVASELGPLTRAAWARSYETLDAGLEWCESELLRVHSIDETITIPTISDWLAREFGNRPAAEEFLRHVQPRELPAGEYLCRQGESAESMFFIAEGQVAVEQQGSDGRAQRLRTLGRHTMIGEMGLYRSELRSASVVARQNSQVYVLTREALARMREDSPALAEALCVALIKAMAERLSYANNLNASLQG